MKWLVNSMLGYWLLLFVISIGTAVGIYEIWLRGKV
jgi:hypothetical protein